MLVEAQHNSKGQTPIIILRKMIANHSRHTQSSAPPWMICSPPRHSNTRESSFPIQQRQALSFFGSSSDSSGGNIKCQFVFVFFVFFSQGQTQMVHNMCFCQSGDSKWSPAFLRLQALNSCNWRKKNSLKNISTVMTLYHL